MLQFHIPDMSCKHCETSICAAIQAQDASAMFTIDLPNHLLSIDSKLDQATLQALIRDLAYTPTVVVPQHVNQGAT